MTKRILGALCASMLVLTTGCSSTRTTTTPRTAIEVALLTRTGTEAISGFQLKNAEGASVVEGKTYKIDDARFEAVEKNFLLSKFNDKVLEAGGIKAVGDDKGTITLEPRVDFANIDDGKWFIGIPAIPLPIPTSAQVITTPEIAILSREHQKGRSQFSV